MIEEAADLVPEGRRVELTADVRRSLMKMADRIDEHYSIEVRSFVVPDGVDEGTPQEEWPVQIPLDVVRAAKAVGARQPQIRKMNLEGRRILELSSGEEDPDAARAEADGEAPDAGAAPQSGPE
jgi:hypothetical protein